MKFKNLKRDLKLSPYAPEWDFTLGFSEVNSIDLGTLYSTILKKERVIKKLPLSKVYNSENFTDGYTGLGKNSTTSRFQHYNVFDWNTKETNQLKIEISRSLVKYNNFLDNKIPQNLWINCWVNILRFGQHITPHLHSVKEDCYLSGHFVVNSKNTSTVYINPVNQIMDPEVVKVENKAGEMTIFPSYVPHYTTKHYSFKPRVTIAFDICLEKYNSSVLL